MVSTFSAVLVFLLGVTSTVTMATDYANLDRLGDIGEQRSPPSKRYYFGYRYGSGYHPRRRQLDRFRFALVGLGKRSVPELGQRTGLEYVEDETDNTNDKTSDLFLVKNILKGRLSTCISGRCKVQSRDLPIGLQETERQLRKSAIRLYKKLLSTDSYKDLETVLRDQTQGKRAPEEFSQDLYPIQAGTQQIEANLDKTFTHIPKIPNPDMMSVKIFNPRPQFLPSEFNDMDTSTDLQDDIEHNEETDNEMSSSSQQRTSPVIDEVPQKRWWAARSLSRFRTPKSHRMHFFPRHVDPVLYFLGLGK